jgi:hypothetical protein
MALDRPDRQAPTIGKHERVHARPSAALACGAQVRDVLLGEDVVELAVHRSSWACLGDVSKLRLSSAVAISYSPYLTP